MSAADLLDRIERIGGRVAEVDGNLRVVGPRAVITPEIEQQVRDCKPALLALLREAKVLFIRMSGRVPPGEDVRAVCALCGPVWLSQDVVASLPLVRGWPYAKRCPWCAVRRAGQTFSRPAVHCPECKRFEPDSYNPAAGMGWCRKASEGTWPLVRRQCRLYRPTQSMETINDH
jgi:hypothetical protein